MYTSECTKKSTLDINVNCESNKQKSLFYVDIFLLQIVRHRGEQGECGVLYEATCAAFHLF